MKQNNSIFRLKKSLKNIRELDPSKRGGIRSRPAVVNPVPQEAGGHGRPGVQNSNKETHLERGANGKKKEKN